MWNCEIRKKPESFLGNSHPLLTSLMSRHKELRPIENQDSSLLKSDTEDEYEHNPININHRFRMPIWKPGTICRPYTVKPSDRPSEKTFYEHGKVGFTAYKPWLSVLLENPKQDLHRVDKDNKVSEAEIPFKLLTIPGDEWVKKLLSLISRI